MRRFVGFPCRMRTAALLIVAAVVMDVPATAQVPSEITVNVFPGGFNWPSFVAQEKGFFERNGIRVILQATPNSVAQMTGLAEGKFDIAVTAVDNIVAYVAKLPSDRSRSSSLSWAVTAVF
jgi:ABC-type nitrate/sulfonate/bicarbonate transport system substrate-binding protein